VRPTNSPLDKARPAPRKTTAELQREWDALADLRFRQIEDGLDLSYQHVLIPAVLQLAHELHGTTVLDAGCGAGFLTAALAAQAEHVVGLDPSPRQISLAQQHHAAGNIEYVTARLQDFVTESPPERFDIAAANMTLMDSTELDGFIASIAHLLRSSGRFIWTITHPWFWPRYWGYADEEWFDYQQEIMIEAPFRISLAPEPIGWTTHVHRPLSRYVDSVRRAGLQLDELRELTPPDKLAKKYPEPWRFPRYLAARCLPYRST
jgi:SAM-dependent methyltransferase